MMSLQKYTAPVSGNDAGERTDSKNETVGDTEGLYLLSLDGGGVRGLSTLYILKAIMLLLNDERQAQGLERVKPCEIFDLIGGTSTGGLIAIMLGRLEMDVNECITEYKTLMRTVFEKKEGLGPVFLNGIIKPRFSSKLLEDVIKRVIKNVNSARAKRPGQKLIPINEPLYLESQKGGPRRCRVFVCAQRKETGSITLLRSYRTKGEDPGEATIWQAALATSAATSFFQPVKIGDCTYGDGALGANNPAAHVEREADRIWGKPSERLESQVRCFVSLGTGHGGINPVSDKAWEFLSKSLKGVATDTEATAEEVAARWRHLQTKPYFRFNVQHGLSEVGLAECKPEKIGLMEAATRDYLDSEETRPRVYRCVTNLRTKEFGVEPSSAAEEKLQATQERMQQQASETMNKAEMAQLTRKGNAYLEQSRRADPQKNLNEAHHIFDKILSAQKLQQPPAEPKELAHTYNKLRSVSYGLSHLEFAPDRRMKYIDHAACYGDRAIECAVASRNDDRVAQMRFYRACVQAQKLELKTEERRRFQAPTDLEMSNAEDAVVMAWTALQSIEGSDMNLYEPMRVRSLRQLAPRG